MRRETTAERAAWTAHVEGTAVAPSNKYNAKRSGKYASKHEAKVAADLAHLDAAGHISDLREQVSFVLVPGDGKLRPIRYVADFVYTERGEQIVADAKGYKNHVYRLKKRLMLHIHGIAIKEL